jgi:5-formyltetrahydrofolate cyclo-ligase
MGTRDMNDVLPLEEKAINAVIEELERQAAENPEKITVKRTGATVSVNGEIDVDALVMVVVGSMAGGP